VGGLFIVNIKLVEIKKYLKYFGKIGCSVSRNLKTKAAH
jgi:hypothetical protein